MDGNLIAMIMALVIYIGSLGIATPKKINLKGPAVISILAAFWFGFQWNSFIGILAVISGLFIGIFLLKLSVGNGK
jgi:hypothetical protein